MSTKLRNRKKEDEIERQIIRKLYDSYKKSEIDLFTFIELKTITQNLEHCRSFRKRF